MNIGPMNDVPLTTAREMFLLDCRAADLASKTLRTYTDILKAFTAYVGDVTVQELAPDHVRSYLADLANRPGRYAENDGKMSSHSLHKHYAVIRTWIRWLFAQKMITERITDLVKPPRLSKRLHFAGRGCAQVIQMYVPQALPGASPVDRTKARGRP